MEVTSEGIDQARIFGIDFDVKVLTNITEDHLDYHKTFDRYKTVKLGFMAEGSAHKIYPTDFADVPIAFETKLFGDFNHSNIKAAATVLRHIGISEGHIRQTLSSCSPPRGRLENVDEGQLFTVLIDFAHTPDGLENVLRTAKDMAQRRNGRLLVLFGCGGDRDSGKRPKMGKIAADIADFVVITDDNPRSENNQKIMAEISGGIAAEFQNYILIQNRREAIEFIIERSQNEDVVILAGKGHETFQIQNSVTIHFDDREESIRAIARRLSAKLRHRQMIACG